MVCNLQLDQALHACYLDDTVSPQSLHFHVKKAEAEQLAQELKDLEEQGRKQGMLVVVPDDSTDETDTSPLTEPEETATANNTGYGGAVNVTKIETSGNDTSSRSISTDTSTKKRRRSAKQASQERVEFKKLKDDYDVKYKAAFKRGTTILHAIQNAADPGEIIDLNGVLGEEVTGEAGCTAANLIAPSLNARYAFNGKKKLSRTSLFRAVSKGMIGVSPAKKKPSPKIRLLLLDLVATHSEVSKSVMVVLNFVGETSRGSLVLTQKGLDMKESSGMSLSGKSFAMSIALIVLMLEPIDNG